MPGMAVRLWPEDKEKEGAESARGWHTFPVWPVVISFVLRYTLPSSLRPAAVDGGDSERFRRVGVQQLIARRRPAV